MGSPANRAQTTLRAKILTLIKPLLSDCERLSNAGSALTGDITELVAKRAIVMPISQLCQFLV
jgi:hypothetical protein